MFRFGMKADTIQFWLLVLTGVGMLISFAGWADARYAKEDRVKKLAWEIHVIYLTVPQDRRYEIEKERVKFELESGQ